MRSGKALGALFTTAVFLVVAWSVLVYAPSAFSATITIDSFDYPNPGRYFYVPGQPPWGSGNPYVHQDPPNPGDPDVPEVLGGERDLFVKVVGSALPISAAGIVGYETVYGDGILKLATSSPGAYAVVQYDGRDIDDPDQLVDSEGLGPVDLTDGGTNTRFRLRFNSVDAGNASTMKLSVTVAGQGGSTTVERQVSEAYDPFDYDLVFSAFPDDGPINSIDILRNADRIEFAFNALATPVSNVDFELDYVEAVPEPATLAMLLGLAVSMLAAGLWCRRKRQT